ncbi:MAG: hypothetical protein, partial [Olavius algarvensis Gamma 1 endosymbiont]
MEAHPPFLLTKHLTFGDRPHKSVRSRAYSLVLAVDPEKIPVLEVDELWSFVFRSKDKVWIWIAMN